MNTREEFFKKIFRIRIDINPTLFLTYKSTRLLLTQDHKLLIEQMSQLSSQLNKLEDQLLRPTEIYSPLQLDKKKTLSLLNYIKKQIDADTNLSALSHFKSQLATLKTFYSDRELEPVELPLINELLASINNSLKTKDKEMGRGDFFRLVPGLETQEMTLERFKESLGRFALQEPRLSFVMSSLAEPISIHLKLCAIAQTVLLDQAYCSNNGSIRSKLQVKNFSNDTITFKVLLTIKTPVKEIGSAKLQFSVGPKLQFCPTIRIYLSFENKNEFEQFQEKLFKNFNHWLCVSEHEELRFIRNKMRWHRNDSYFFPIWAGFFIASLLTVTIATCLFFISLTAPPLLWLAPAVIALFGVLSTITIRPVFLSQQQNVLFM